MFQNFRDPLGLIVRMLRSSDRAAHAALYREFLRTISTPLDWSLQWTERKRLREPLSLDYPLILLVGGPRSGSTLAYQAICQHLDVAYFDNLSSLFPRSPLTASHKFSRWMGSKATDYKSYFGNTRHLQDPNDGFHIWNRWLGEDRYRVTEKLDPRTQKQMQRFFSAWTQVSKKPIANKNNRNLVCIGELSRALPNTYFVVVRRDPRLVAQSLIRARKIVQGDTRIGWGLLSSDSEGTEPLAYVDDVCKQIRSIEEELARQTAIISNERLIHWSHEKFCADPRAALENLTRLIPQTRLKDRKATLKLSPFPANTQLTLEKPVIERIEALLAEPEPTLRRGSSSGSRAC